MTTATQANVTKLYIATFDRAPDGPGLNYWINSGMSVEAIAQSFFDQPETQTKYAGVTLQKFVETLYQNVLGRDGEAAGITYWKGELESNHITKDQAIIAIINGALGTDATLLDNKTTVGIHYAQFGDNAPDAFQVIDETKLDAESVSKCIDWIDGKIPAQYTPSTYNVLDDNRVAYDLTGSAKDDVFVVEAFKSAVIKGGEGSDTLDFQDFSPKGVSVNLATGIGPNGANGTAMKFEWIENIRGTSGNDVLVGNADKNILVSMGGTDSVDGGVGDDRLLFRNVSDVANAVLVNGGQNTDTLEITDQTDISVGATTFSKVSDVEILQVGYSEEGTPAAATITLTAASAPGTMLNTFKEIRGTDSFDKKGVAAKDVIQSGFNMDVSTVKLTSIEELKATAANTAITVGKDTLACVSTVTGHDSKTTDLLLSAKAGDVFDLTVPTFSNIDRIAQLQVVGADVASTVIVNQSLINSLATSDFADGFGASVSAVGAPDVNPVAGFTQSTLRASGIGMDLGALRDGDTNFKSIEFGTAKEVTIGNINDSVLAAAITAAVTAGVTNAAAAPILQIATTTAGAAAPPALAAAAAAAAGLVVVPTTAQQAAVIAAGDASAALAAAVVAAIPADIATAAAALTAAAAALKAIAPAFAGAADAYTLAAATPATAALLTTANIALTTAATATDVAAATAGAAAAAAVAAAVGTAGVNQATVTALVAALNADATDGTALTLASVAADIAAVNVADLSALRSIVGSENNADLLRVLPDAVGAQDLTYLAAGVRTGISITKVERLDFEETSTVALMNANLTDVKQISGDNDRVGIVNDLLDLNDNGTVIDAGYETAVGGLDLKGKTIHDIAGLGNNVSGKNGTVTIDSTTTWDSNFKSLDSDSKQTIIAADAGSYDFSSIRTASGAQVAFAPTTGAATITYFDKFVGSAGNDIVKGGADSFGYDLGKGDDTFIGTDTANELVVGGEGNDTITLGDNTDVTDTLQLWDLPFVQGANTGRLINSLSLGGKSDYVGETFLVGKGTLPDATFVSFEDGAYADGGAGDDKITSGLGDDVLIGGAGNDSISGGKGSDIISAGEGDDILSGGEGGDFLAGGAGNDLLEGNAGEDYLFGGKGRDVMRGDELDAAGNIQYLARDHFIFEAGDSGATEQTVDIIKDFLSTDLASTLDLDGNGIKGDEHREDTIYQNWFAADASVAGNAIGPAVDTTGVVGAGLLSGTSYQTFTSDIGNTAVGTTLEAAANSALDKAYAALNLNGLLAAAAPGAAPDYTSEAVQFEYGGKEYLVIDSYVTGGFVASATQTAVQVGQAANNYNAGNDLIVEIADTAVSWSISADDIVVTRWDVGVI